VFKISDRKAQNEFVEKVLDIKEASENIKDLGTELTKSQKELATKEVVSKAYEAAQIESAVASGNSKAANEAIRDATESRASVAAEIGKLPREDQRKVTEESKRIEDETKRIRELREREAREHTRTW
jgi:hypothetical protein